MRVGLVGTGHWAAINHAPVIAEKEGLVFEGLWGRSPAATAELAHKFGVQAFQSFEQLVQSVDIVQFAVPPAVQAPLAVHAAHAGKHLLLEKPLALSTADAESLRIAVEQSGVAALVFLPARFRPETERWITEMSGGNWTGASGQWFTQAISGAQSPWSGSAWRRENGGLWDLGPHALSILIPILGKARNGCSLQGRSDLMHLLLEHDDQRTSSTSFTLCAPSAACREELSFWGENGVFHMPPVVTGPQESLGIALTELCDLVESGQRAHACDVRFGRDIVEILEAATRGNT
ncbi:Gfo/Idh/MocA family oxidoreductase [Arthrobacter oryzae]|uniref:Gfo/Idh/MocA family protein n=1 Tax=Arthrobacter oryzae TaxID=409290 RepID=UPI0028624142|nr:Gfo/Idh/MocA family oxidoreductase [Arthrobacter oryzae]MDR6507652.1 putative dehydrogenase [Arthrobacter oryzae]